MGKETTNTAGGVCRITSFQSYGFTLSLDGCKVSTLSHAYLNKPLREIKVDICNRQLDNPFDLRPDVCSGYMQGKKKLWSYLTLNVLSETRCH